MIATSKQFRKLVTTHFYENIQRSQYGSHSWTDKTSDPEMRRCTIKLWGMSKENAVKLLEDLKFLMFMSGYENPVSLREGFDRTYLRFKAKI